MLSFPLVVKWLAWKIGRRGNMRLDMDPWVGCRENSHLLVELLEFNQEEGFYSLSCS